MTKTFRHIRNLFYPLAIVFLGTTEISSAQATPKFPVLSQSLQQIDQYQNSGSNSLSQVTNVNQLRDVSPTDWAYEALRSLVDRYSDAHSLAPDGDAGSHRCIAGFPNQTYRGNQALSRYEFAAGLNSCLNQIERLVASSEAVVREDIDTISRLTQEFEAELATLSGRVDDLASRTAFLEDNQFSTTTKLKGEVIFSITDTFGDGEGTNSDPTQVTFSDRVRLNLHSSFYGQDRLRIRLEAGNSARLDQATGFDITRTGFDANNDNNIAVTDLAYRFPVKNSGITGYVGVVGLDTDDIFEVQNSQLASSSSGALSRFSRRNPLLFRGTEGAGVGIGAKLGVVTVRGLYLTDDADESGDREGLFNGSFSTGTQLEISPTDTLDLAFTYIYEYQTGDSVNLTGSTGSDLAQEPFGEVDTRAHQFGLGANYAIGKKIVLAAWGGLSLASDINNNDNATLYTAAINASLIDLGKEGAVFSLLGGIPPNLTNNDAGAEDEDTTFLIEALYKYPINNNVSLTPGAFVVINPEGNSNNETQVVGVLRTTFKF